METNTATVSTPISSTPRLTQERPAEGVQSRGDQSGSSAAFRQQTNVSIETAIDHMADVLSKISGRQQTNVEQMPQELKEVIRSILRQSFSIETTLGQGLGSTAASQRFSTDQMTTLARMLNQLSVLSEEGAAPRVSDDLAAILTGLKSAIAKEMGGTFEPVMLTKAAFQLLDTGNAELLPKELQTFMSNLVAQRGAPPATLAGTTSLSFLNQLVQQLMPKNTEIPLQPAIPNVARGAQESGGAGTPPSPLPGQESQTVRTAIPPAGQNNTVVQENEIPLPAQGRIGQDVLSAQKQGTPTGVQSQAAVQDMSSKQEANMPTNLGAQPNTSAAEPTKSALQTQMGREGEGLSTQGEQRAALEKNAAGRTPNLQTPEAEGASQGAKAQLQSGESLAQNQRAQGDMSTAVRTDVKPPTQTAENAAEGKAPIPQEQRTQSDTSLPRRNTQASSPETQAAASKAPAGSMENTPQTMNALRNLAQTLLQNGTLSPKETALLQNFVNGRNQTLSAHEAAQLQKLIQLTQTNVPGTVRQAAMEQQLPDLPRLWAFMQMADLVKTRKMTAEQYKRAGRDVAALALSMRTALEGENAAPQPGQRSMNFVMPLFMGEAEYPAYIHVYDEAHQDEESERIKKETWLRICVLTDHIGTVELINRIYEENHVDMRLYFSDADAAWEFRNHLDQIRETAEGTSLIIEGIQIGALGERRFFTN